MPIVEKKMLKRLRQYIIIPVQETHIRIHILKYSSSFIVLGVRLTKCKQTHPDIPLTAQQMFTFLFTH